MLYTTEIKFCSVKVYDQTGPVVWYHSMTQGGK